MTIANKRRSLEERILAREERSRTEKAELSKVHELQSHLSTAALQMVGDLGIQTENDNAAWAYTRQCCGIHSAGLRPALPTSVTVRLPGLPHTPPEPGTVPTQQ